MLARILKSVQYASVPLRQCPSQLGVFTQIKCFSEKINESASNDSINNQKTETDTKLGSFAKAFEEIEQLTKNPNEKPVECVPFKKMLRESNLIDVSHNLTSSKTKNRTN